MNARSIAAALGAAVLFGASTPAAKSLVGEVHPVLLAGLLYAGSGIGLGAWVLVRQRPIALPAHDLPWLLAAVLAGGVLGPIALMVGLTLTTASTASLLLNLEGVFTAVLAWVVFRENFDRRIAIGMALIVAGGIVLSFQSDGTFAVSAGALAVAVACLAWAVDNNLTRRVSGADAAAIAAIKGAVAGTVNVGLALLLGAEWPSGTSVALAACIGLFGYGVSLALFVVALRGLGTARTGAYFSTAPFVGVVFALLLLGEKVESGFWVAALLMAAGVWLHLTERHEHEHLHEAMEHEHAHTHDEHHDHEHGADGDGREPHSHRHSHRRMVHSHPHYPDLHHRHH